MLFANLFWILFDFYVMNNIVYPLSPSSCPQEAVQLSCFIPSQRVQECFEFFFHLFWSYVISIFIFLPLNSSEREKRKIPIVDVTLLWNFAHELKFFLPPASRSLVYAPIDNYPSMGIGNSRDNPLT